jgi:hypothetical protein
MHRHSDTTGVWILVVTEHEHFPPSNSGTGFHGPASGRINTAAAKYFF